MQDACFKLPQFNRNELGRRPRTEMVGFCFYVAYTLPKVMRIDGDDDDDNDDDNETLKRIRLFQK